MSQRAWLFDLDGTLADTAPDLGGALNAMRIDRGMEPLPAAVLRAEASNGARGLLQRGLDLAPEHPAFADARTEFLERYRQRLAEETHLFPGIGAVIARLEEQGRLWGIVTNKPIALARPLVAALQLQPQVLLGGDSAIRAKPDPSALWLACAHLRTAPARCLYLGDAPRDIEAGRRAGLRTVACGWGYVEQEPDPADWGADLYARAVSDLNTLLP